MRFCGRFCRRWCVIARPSDDEWPVDMEMGILQGDSRIGNFLLLPGDAVQILLRPDDIQFVENGGVPAKVEERAFRGPTTLYALRLKSG